MNNNELTIVGKSYINEYKQQIRNQKTKHIEIN